MARPDDADPPRKLAGSLIIVDCSHDVFTDHGYTREEKASPAFEGGMLYNMA